MALRQRDDTRLRALVAQECGRIMAEEGVADFLTAKRKAAERLGLSPRSPMPSNVEIEQAMVAYQRLFKSSRQPEQLRELRRTAMRAMQFFERFRPRLVGPVLDGSAGAHAHVNLHLFADAPEEVVLFLMEHGVPHRSGERRMRFGSGETVSCPVLSFLADGVPVELVVFPRTGAREAPRSPVDGKPMRRASIGAVQALLEDAGS